MITRSIRLSSSSANIELKSLLAAFVIILLVNTPLSYLKSERIKRYDTQLRLVEQTLNTKNTMVGDYFHSLNVMVEHGVAKSVITAMLDQRTSSHPYIFDQHIDVKPLPCQPTARPHHFISKGVMRITQPLCVEGKHYAEISAAVDLSQYAALTTQSTLVLSDAGVIVASTLPSLAVNTSIEQSHEKVWQELEVTGKKSGSFEYSGDAVVFKKFHLLGVEPAVVMVMVDDNTLIPSYFYVAMIFLACFVGILVYLYQLRKEKALLSKISYTDQLSGLYNRHYLAKLSNEITAKGKYYLCLFDIDHFKKINDTYGHDIGDQVIRRVAVMIKSRTRPNDHVIRLGGEEFLLIINTDSSELAHGIAERIRRDIEQVEQKPHITLSAGVCKLETTLQDCIKTADGCLYSAKTSGRNKIICC